jgi:predicted lipid-binding transport protein (Tim44 family)
MDLYVGLALVVMLLAVLVVARLTYRRQKLPRRQRGSPPSQGLAKATARSDMRAYDDTSTLIDAVARAAPPSRPAPPPDRGPASVRRKP